MKTGRFQVNKNNDATTFELFRTVVGNNAADNLNCSVQSDIYLYFVEFFCVRNAINSNNTSHSKF